ncbi:MAG: AMP-binding protein [Actinomycetota bacterium]
MVLDRLASLVSAARRAGALDPRQFGASAAAISRWGASLVVPYAAAAARFPERAAVIDDHETVSYAELDQRSTQLAAAMSAAGLNAGDVVGLMARNGALFLDALVATSKCGLVPVLLNTEFAPEQLVGVLDREDVVGLVHDGSTADVVAAAAFDGVTLDQHAGASLPADGAPPMPRQSLRNPVVPILLTSGTTGTPKGARRSLAADPRPAIGVLERIPVRTGDTVYIACPLFHAWGFAQLLTTGVLAGTVVVSARFDVEATITAVERRRPDVLVTVPTVLQRLLGSDALDGADLSSLRVVACSGSALPMATSAAWLDRVGDNLYNLYGSTEVGQATLATPDDLRVAPGTVGRPISGTEVAILDDSGARVRAGEVGAIHVGSGSNFQGYTGGGGKAVVDGLMATGDVGYLDDDGRLFVTGRTDDMIVSGGENVYPLEVEELLLTDAGVADVAVVGVPDDDFGGRLVAYVVRVPGSEIGEADLKAMVAARLSRFKVPRMIEFVDELPRTATGKVLRRRLADE